MLIFRVDPFPKFPIIFRQKLWEVTHPVGDACKTLSQIPFLRFLNTAIYDEGLSQLSTNSSIDTLKLNSCGIGEKGVEIFSITNRTVTSLHLIKNKIGTYGAVLLSQMESLCGLHLSQNQIRNKGAEAFEYSFNNLQILGLSL